MVCIVQAVAKERHKTNMLAAQIISIPKMVLAVLTVLPSSARQTGQRCKIKQNLRIREAAIHLYQFYRSQETEGHSVLTIFVLIITCSENGNQNDQVCGTTSR